MSNTDKSNQLNYLALTGKVNIKQIIIKFFYLFVSNSAKTCKNGSKKTKNANYLTLFDKIDLKKCMFCMQNK